MTHGLRILLVLLVAGCARLPITAAIPTRAWTETARHDSLARAVERADGYVVGTVERADEAWLYDDICGGLSSLFGWCGGTVAYRLSIRATDPIRLYVFVPRGDSLALPVGTRAVFLWEMAWIRRLQECGQRMRVGLPRVCESDELPVVPSRAHVAAPTDSAYVAWLFARKGGR